MEFTGYTAILGPVASTERNASRNWDKELQLKTPDILQTADQAAEMLETEECWQFGGDQCMTNEASYRPWNKQTTLLMR